MNVDEIVIMNDSSSYYEATSAQIQDICLLIVNNLKRTSVQDIVASNAVADDRLASPSPSWPKGQTMAT